MPSCGSCWGALGQDTSKAADILNNLKVGSARTKEWLKTVPAPVIEAAEEPDGKLNFDVILGWATTLWDRYNAERGKAAQAQVDIKTGAITSTALTIGAIVVGAALLIKNKKSRRRR